jgi:hypothetical protein
MRRIDVSVRPVEAPENSSLASITGFYGTAVAPPGSAMIAWQGTTDTGPQRPGDKGKEDEQQGQPNPPGDDEDPGPPPEPEDPQDGTDPSDPTQPH